MKEILPPILCIIIMAYIIYLEFKSTKPNRDLFVDSSISIIIMIVGVYSMYEFHFDFHKVPVLLYLGLLALGAFYMGLVFYRMKHLKKNAESKNQVKEASESSDEHGD